MARYKKAADFSGFFDTARFAGQLKQSALLAQTGRLARRRIGLIAQA
jgi:hypothetical protein